jgi:hypothetical protein
MQLPAVEKATLRVLLIQHSLSGETNTATHEFLRGLSDGAADLHNLQVAVVEHNIRARPAFQFPWDFWSFFDVMPETVVPSVRVRNAQHWSVEAPTLEKTVSSDPAPSSSSSGGKSFDLVVLGWQTWFLSPSLPVRLAVHDPEYQPLFRKAPVLLIGTHRNMWHRASRTLRRELKDNANAKVIGGINFVQSSAFLVSVVKTLRWQLRGEIDASGATNAKDQAFAEGRNFLKQYQNGNWPANYEAGKPYSHTLALLEDVWFPCKSAACRFMGLFPPKSVSRKVITALYVPLLMSAILFVAPPVLFVGTILTEIKRKTATPNKPE